MIPEFQEHDKSKLSISQSYMKIKSEIFLAPIHPRLITLLKWKILTKMWKVKPQVRSKQSV